ncbi:MAG: class I tRNA ligase family protein, partial [Desulfurococcales archaeon]|nr:class I tRNA ligase family protein [Desulfurococcales archaeon]
EVRTQADTEKLEKATKEVYREEHAKGVLLEGLSDLVVEEVVEGVKDFIRKELEGVPVSEAREKVKRFLIASGYGSTMFEIMNAPVYCRCGTEIVVKVVKDQWFINYGNEEWKRRTLKALSKMRIVPEEARKQFVATVDWLRAKACARSRGLGTELPWAKGWVIESLSDSTIYMAFYTVIHKIRGYSITPDKLTPEFWDYVMRGEGDVKKLSDELGLDAEVLEELREEFDYWYPLDSRHSGKDLIPNHLTFFVFNHAAIFPEDKWPKQIVANGWVLIKGEKMSKSKGNVRTLHGLIRTYSPDAVRLALSVEAEVEGDLNLDLDSMGKIYDHLRRIKKLVSELSASEKVERFGLPERWVRSKVARHLLRAYSELSDVRIRAAGVRIFYLIPKVLEEYLSMVAKPSKVVDDLLDMWVKAISAFTPFLAEEIWHEYLRKDTLVVKELWPSEEDLKSLVDDEAEAYIAYAKKVVEDLKSISKVVGGKEAVIYVSPREDQKHLLKIREVVDGGGKLGDVIKYVTKVWGRASGKKAVRVAKALVDMVSAIDPDVIESLRRLGGVDEISALNTLKTYIEAKAGVRIVEVFRADDPEAPDHGGRKEEALPWRPSIYLRRE